MNKYIKPKSLTFWASMVSLSLGVFLAFEPIHGLVDWIDAVNNLTGNVGSYALIQAGLVGIGLRGAL
jgi:hypothetical protein